MVKIFEVQIGNPLGEAHRSVFYACMEWDQVALEDYKNRIIRNLELTVPSLNPRDPREEIISIKEIFMIDMSQDRNAALQLNETINCYTHIDVI